jgi:hypothetical protein
MPKQYPSSDTIDSLAAALRAVYGPDSQEFARWMRNDAFRVRILERRYQQAFPHSPIAKRISASRETLDLALTGGRVQ